MDDDELRFQNISVQEVVSLENKGRNRFERT
jgi:hypothetical protein